MTPLYPRCRDTVKHLLRVMTRTGRLPSVPNQPKTPQRSVRVPDEVWQAAKARADAEGRTLSDVVRTSLENYAKGKGRKRT